MFLIINSLIEESLSRTIMFKISYRIHFIFVYLCVKFKLEELRGHKVMPVIMHQIDFLPLASSMCLNIL